jgi:hypothetical protein
VASVHPMPLVFCSRRGRDCGRARSCVQRGLIFECCFFFLFYSNILLYSIPPSLSLSLSFIERTEPVGGQVTEFLTQTRDLLPAGELTESKSFPFEFLDSERPHESYNGINISLNYYVRLTIQRKMNMSITRNLELWQRNYSTSPDAVSSIKMEVGIEDCLHIEFEYNKSKYGLDGAGLVLAVANLNLTSRISIVFVDLQISYVDTI